jgi:rare lipoprotein A
MIGGTAISPRFRHLAARTLILIPPSGRIGVFSPHRVDTARFEIKSTETGLMRVFLIGAAVLTGLGAFGTAPAMADGTRTFSGIASYYAKNYRGKTASGEKYDETKMTAAHKTLPFGTKVVVTDKKTHRSVTVRINDRGPFVKGRVIDLSYAAATEMKLQGRGLAQVMAVAQ